MGCLFFYPAAIIPPITGTSQSYSGLSSTLLGYFIYIMENTQRKFTFKKEERLKSRKEIDRLFSEGASFHQYPFRWVWAERSEEIQPNPYPIQVGVSVSKRRFKLAVDRNHVKRLCRESWRLSKHNLYPRLDAGYSIMLIYTGKGKLNFSYIKKRMRMGMKEFIKQSSKSSNNQ